jgi:hypothetical protein
VMQKRESAEWVTTNINVHDNTVTQRTGMPAGAAIDIPGHDPVAYYGGIKFDRNAYRVTSGNQSRFEWWDGGGRSWSQWRAYGLDVSGSLTIIP